MITLDAMLTAAITDWLFPLVPIVFFVIYVFNQLLSAKGNQQQQRRNPPRRQPQRVERPLRPAQPQAGQPQGGTAQLNAEIEQFLKRAGQRRGERQQPDRATRAPAPPSAPKSPRGAPTAARREAMREQPIDVMPVETRRFGTVAESVEQHLRPDRFADRAAHLADEVTHADEDMEEHLQEVFSHRLGTLNIDSAGSTAPATDTLSTAMADASSPAAALAQLLRTPAGMRQAIVLGEVLARPEQRW